MIETNSLGESRAGFHGGHQHRPRDQAWEDFDLVATRYIMMLAIIDRLEAGGAGQQAAAADLTANELAELWAALTDEIYPALVDSRPT